MSIGCVFWEVCHGAATVTLVLQGKLSLQGEIVGADSNTDVYFVGSRCMHTMHLVCEQDSAAW